jgi:predicted PurR-regulated permease PerM
MTSEHRPRQLEPVLSDHEHVAKISTQTAIALIAGIALFLYEIQIVLLPFVLAGLLAYICTPIIDWITTRTRMPRPLFAIAAFLIIVSVAALIGWLGVPSLVQEVSRVSSDLQGTTAALARSMIGDDTIGVLGQAMDATKLAETMAASIRDWMGNPRMLAQVAGAAFAGMFGVFLTFVLLFYFLLSGPSIGRGLIWLVPPGHRHLIDDHIWSFIDPVLKRYFIGVIAIILYASGAAYIGLGVFLGVPHAVFLALLTGLLEVIPIVGPAAAIGVAGLVAVQHASGPGAIIGYAAYVIALRLSIDQLLGPLVLGAAGRVHPVLIIFCFLAGGILFGIVGVILAVPVTLVIRVTLAVLYDESPGLKPPASKTVG